VAPPLPSIHDVFELRVATDDRTEADAFSVRWQVYCQEYGYEPGERFPDHCECDSADLRSVSVVAYYRATGAPVGCFRLLFADPARVDEPFHLEEVCVERDPGSIPERGNARMGCAEISRFCILAPFRRFTRTADAQPPAGLDAARWESDRRQNLAALMWLSAAHLAVHLRLDCLLALMEPRLQAACRSIGFTFHPIGPPVEFRGQRVPYRIDRRALRALLALPQTAALLAPIAPRWEAQASAHPQLVNYLAAAKACADRRDPGTR
jgi:N-acyl amino acid synthase of PEP-CTERM/exosortase system